VCIVDIEAAFYLDMNSWGPPFVDSSGALSYTLGLTDGETPAEEQTEPVPTNDRGLYFTG